MRAGNFSEWLRGAEASLKSGNSGAEVPCGTCTACCRSSLFIHIEPVEKQTIARISRELLFPAPGLPKGRVVMGYNDHGHCPMLVNDKCSIYEHRPRTCRTYDCRIFAATGIPVEQAEIAQRAAAWVFDYEDDHSREEQALLKKAAAFLRENHHLFPKGRLPAHSAQLAALAVSIYPLFEDSTAGMQDAQIAQTIAALLHSRSTRSHTDQTF